LTDAISGEGIDELLQSIWDHKEYLELSESINERKKKRFTYKIKELIYSKIEKLISENFINKQEINEIVNHAVDDGKFKIYRTIHNKFEDVNFEIKKRN
jgi:LAO/AO transport system kinase